MHKLWKMNGGKGRMIPKIRVFPRWKDLHGIDTRKLGLPSVRGKRKGRTRVRDIFKDV